AETDAAGLVRFVADHFTVLANEKHIQFDVVTPPEVSMEVDAVKLQRILLNLLGNAFKFTPHFGQVRVSLEETPTGLRIEVGDSGPGIPVGRREQVFDRFRQFHTDADRQFTGTGLGLSIVRDFVVLLGGSISIGDAPEGGSLFTLDLPAAAPAGSFVRT